LINNSVEVHLKVHMLSAQYMNLSHLRIHVYLHVTEHPLLVEFSKMAHDHESVASF